MLYKLFLDTLETCWGYGFKRGWGDADRKKNLGLAASKEDCVAMVKTMEPSADGASFNTNHKTCEADFGWRAATILGNLDWYRTCQFRGITICSRIITLTY